MNKSFVRHERESHFQKFNAELVEIVMFFTTYTATLHSIRYLQFVDLVRITSIASKWIGLKAPVIERVVFAIKVRCNFSPLFNIMRCNSVTDCVVCFPTYRTRCTRILFNFMACYDKFSLGNTKSPCVLSVRWKNIPTRIPQYQNPRRFYQRYQEKRSNAPWILCISWFHPIVCPKLFSIRWMFGI